MNKRLQSDDVQISEDKKKWMQAVGIRKFHRPMRYYSRAGHIYSEEHIRDTPLEELIAGYEKTFKQTK
ncbi:hypothetical protein EDM59_01725 [Brevibacillus nitrificans]|uniref:Uncharacterized protein n=1 Tax=Brevibacillus nitrificans TaxID=651560 RepID=A0A3M8DRS6_9BACL|nr:hypothetical protein [Brevibacillus nitrificans]RNB90189.1 hypothetical protein EDM59_01725 [Brevibacillus nitrificans]